MKLSSNLVNFYGEFEITEIVDILAESGFDGIDFCTDKEEYYTEAHPVSFYKELKAYANDKGISFYQAHAPFSSSYVEEEKTKQRFYDIVTAMKHAAALGAEALVVHPYKHLDYRDKSLREALLDMNFSFYNRLIPYAEEYGIKIAVENIRATITESAEGLKGLVDALANPVFTVCFDVGHANLVCDNPAEMIRRAKGYIGYTHIHDNDGAFDLHRLPFYGNIEWEEVMKALAEIGYDGNLNYESGRFLDNVPSSLRAEGAKYMAKVGRHLIERYEHYKNLQANI